MRHRPLHGTQADHDAQLDRQLLAYHVRIAPVTPEPLTQPSCVFYQKTGPGQNPAGRPSARCQVSLHRLPIAANLDRDPPRTPAKTMKPLHQRHLVRRPHRLSPPVLAGRRNVQSIRQLASPCYAGWLGS